MKDEKSFFSEKVFQFDLRMAALRAEIEVAMKNGNYCDCNRKNAIKFGGFKKCSTFAPEKNKHKIVNWIGN